MVHVLNGGHNVSPEALKAVTRPSAGPGTSSTGTPAAIPLLLMIAGTEDRETLAEAGLPQDPALVHEGDYSRAGGEAAMTALLAAAPDLDAVFVASDLMADGALAALERAGRRVPGDVAVGGFDDSTIAASTRPALTTVRQPWDRIGAEMVRLLLSLIAGEPPASVILPTELVHRASA
jgi:DNA-binding LacI/PurR family transcriptional regulator